MHGLQATENCSLPVAHSRTFGAAVAMKILIQTAGEVLAVIRPTQPGARATDALFKAQYPDRMNPGPTRFLDEGGWLDKCLSAAGRWVRYLHHLLQQNPQESRTVPIPPPSTQPRPHTPSPHTPSPFVTLCPSFPSNRTEHCSLKTHFMPCNALPHGVYARSPAVYSAWSGPSVVEATADRAAHAITGSDPMNSPGRPYTHFALDTSANDFWNASRSACSFRFFSSIFGSW